MLSWHSICLKAHSRNSFCGIDHQNKTLPNLKNSIAQFEQTDVPHNSEVHIENNLNLITHSEEIIARIEDCNLANKDIITNSKSEEELNENCKIQSDFDQPEIKNYDEIFDNITIDIAESKSNEHSIIGCTSPPLLVSRIPQKVLKPKLLSQHIF